MINSINETFEKSGLLDKIIIYFKNVFISYLALHQKDRRLFLDVRFPQMKTCFLIHPARQDSKSRHPTGFSCSDR